MSLLAIMDQYSLVKVIGQGSFGRALLVQPINGEQNYVMKEIRLPKVMKAQHFLFIYFILQSILIILLKCMKEFLYLFIG